MKDSLYFYPFINLVCWVPNLWLLILQLQSIESLTIEGHALTSDHWIANLCLSIRQA